VGRECSEQERKDYFKYDLEYNERETIANLLMEHWPELEAALGGQISIDITPKGLDKSQALQHIMKEQPNKQYFFVGDRTIPGGNDYPLAKLMEETDDCSAFQTGDPADKLGYLQTIKILNGIGESNEN
jgi:phosphomannomutase